MNIVYVNEINLKLEKTIKFMKLLYGKDLT